MAVNSLVVVGLGYGDEGKGSIVDFLCSEFDIDFVVKYSGGHQAGHRVVVGDKEHVFSQYGAGALAGVPTILDREFIIEPLAMKMEYEALGRLGACTELHIHRDCPVTTPYHRAFNRLRESHVGHGSCGVGVGITRKTDILGIGLLLSDLHGGESPAVSKLRRIRSYLISEVPLFDPDKESAAYQEFVEEVNRNPRDILGELNGSLPAMWSLCDVSCAHFTQGSNIVFEGSQGVLLDELHGSHPNTTWSTVTPRNALEFAGVDIGKTVVIGVMRTYLTRHGNGFMGLGDTQEEITAEDPNNQWNQWQGHMRRMPWQQEVLDRAIKIAKPDCLAVNHCDVERLGGSGAVEQAILGVGPDRSHKRWLKSTTIDNLQMKKRS